MARLHACRSLRYRDGVLLARVWLQEVPGGRGIRLGAQTPEESVERGASVKVLHVFALRRV